MALRLSIKVIPSSGRMEFVLDKEQRLKCYLKAPAQDGKANKELIKFVAQLCSVRQVDVDIVVGLINPNKILLINSSMSYEQFLKIAGLELQNSIF